MKPAAVREGTHLGLVGLVPGRNDIDDGDEPVPLVVHPDPIRPEGIDPVFIEVFE